MKVELQSGDTIAIPEGCKAVVKDGIVTIEKEVQEFKDGDVLVSVEDVCWSCPFIYKSTDRKGFHAYYVGINCYGDISFSTSPNNRWGNSELTYAPESAKAKLFDKLKEQGLRWNEEEKRVEKIRWRAKKGKCYYFTDTMSIMSHLEADDKVDRLLWRSCNYFRTREQAEEAARRVKETLRKYHEETGE
jgi:hypothetical protein